MGVATARARGDVDFTARSPCCFGTATHHWRVLREAGVIHQRPDGRATMAGLRRDDLDARFPGLLDTVLAVRPRILEGVSGMLPD